ncbi:hypothetical protein BH10PSE5_BH10PSE5_23660 [soil metagenome]
MGLFAIPAFLSGFALAGAIPVARLPIRLQAFPAAITYSVICFVLLGITNLSAASDVVEIRHGLLRSAAFGGGLGLVLGAITSFAPKDEKPDDSLADWQRHLLVIGSMASVVLVGVFLLAQPRPRDDGRYEEFARLGGSERYFAVGARTPPLTDESFGVVQISDPVGSNVLVLENSEWPAFAQLWMKAREIRSTSWQPAGETSDTVGSDKATVAVSGGPGVRFKISSPHSPTLIYEVAPSEIPRLDAAITKTGQRLGQ